MPGEFVKSATIVDVLVNVGTAVAGWVRKRREAKEEQHGEQGGHPVFPLDEAKRRADERRRKT